MSHPYTQYRLTHDQTTALFAEFGNTGSDEAFDRLVLGNMGLVYKVARKWAWLDGLSLDDLVQVGVTGLMRAVEKFDMDRGARFSTYAMHWIRQSITRFIRSKGFLIHYPAHIWDRDGWDSTLAAMPVARSLDAPALPYVDDAECLRATIADESESNDMEKTVSQAERRNLVKNLVDRLPAREALIIADRFGLNADEAIMTLDGIGEELDISAERVRQLEQKAINKLWRMITREGLVNDLRGT